MTSYTTQIQHNFRETKNWKYFLKGCCWKMDSGYEAALTERVVERDGCKKMKKDLFMFCHCLILKHRSWCHSLLFGFFSNIRGCLWEDNSLFIKTATRIKKVLIVKVYVVINSKHHKSNISAKNWDQSI